MTHWISDADRNSLISSQLRSIEKAEKHSNTHCELCNKLLDDEDLDEHPYFCGEHKEWSQKGDK